MPSRPLSPKLMVFFLSFSLLFQEGSLLAQLSPAAPLPAGMPAGLVGVVAAARGDVEIGKSGEVGRVAGSGEAIYLGDEVRTDAAGQLQILLLDETVFTIGPNSAIVIDTFVYDPATHDGKIDARVLKGVFRFITGQIAHKKPSNVEVKLPTGSVGVRGTIFYGKIEGNSSTVLLLGPGERNNTGHRAGKIIVSNEVNGRLVETEVKKSGFGSFIQGENVPPTAAYEIPKEQINEMIAAVNPVQAPEKTELQEQKAEQKQSSSAAQEESRAEAAETEAQGTQTSEAQSEQPASDDRKTTSGDSKSAGPQPPSGPGGVMPGTSPDGGSPRPPTMPMAVKPNTGTIPDNGRTATHQSGQDGAFSYNFLRDLSAVTEINKLLFDTSRDASLDIGDQNAGGGTQQPFTRTATFDELRARTEMGTYHYEGSGVLVHGSYTFKMNINFGSRTMGGDGSAMQVNSSVLAGGSPFSMAIGTESFTSHVGIATKSIALNNPDKNTTGTLTVNFFEAGTNLTHSVTMTTGSTDTDSGAGTATLQPGGS